MSVMPSYSKSKDSKDLEDGGAQCRFQPELFIISIVRFANPLNPLNP